MHQNNPNHSSKTHFGLLRLPGAHVWPKDPFFEEFRGFFGSWEADFFSKWLVLPHYKVLGGFFCQILISPIYRYTLLI